MSRITSAKRKNDTKERCRNMIQAKKLRCKRATIREEDTQPDRTSDGGKRSSRTRNRSARDGEGGIMAALRRKGCNGECRN